MKYAKVYFEDVEVGSEMPPLVKGPIEQIQLTRYAGASGDFNPIHHDEPFAKAAGYPSVFAHGMLSMGLTGRLLTDWLGDGVLRSFGVRFVRQVWPGDTLTGRATVRSLEPGAGEGLVGIDVVATNQKGEPVVTGEATAALPRRG